MQDLYHQPTDHLLRSLCHLGPSRPVALDDLHRAKTLFETFFPTVELKNGAAGIKGLGFRFKV